MGSDLVAPRTPVEARLAMIWVGLLGLSPVSIHDDFFDLGGHSLMATQLVLRINDVFQVELPRSAIFTSSTIAELASTIVELQTKQMTDEELLVLLDFDPGTDNEDRIFFGQS